MANDDHDQPDDTEWVVTKHTHFPIHDPVPVVIGRYPTKQDASEALNQMLQSPQWFTTYAVEHRRK